ncbi:MAG: hypothetical protein ACLQVD_11935 [Capsulimonadaceae bacterium]
MVNSFSAVRCPQCGNERAADSSPCPVCGMAGPAAWPAPLVPYQFSGKCPPSGRLLLTAVALLSGIAIGMGYHTMAMTTDYPVISALVGGTLSGLVVLLLAKKAHCRNLKMIVAFGFLSGILVYSTRVVADSQAFRPAMVRHFTRQLVSFGVPRAEAQSRVEHGLNPWTTLRLYLDLQSRAGVTITDSNSSSYSVNTGSGTQQVGGTQLSGTGYWLLLLGELVAAGFGGMCLPAALGKGLDPYCERDGCWMKGKRLLRLAPGQAGSVAAVIQAQDWVRLTQIAPQGAMNDQNRVDVVVNRCPICRSGTIAVINVVANSITTPLHVMLDGGVISQFLEAKLQP